MRVAGSSVGGRFVLDRWRHVQRVAVGAGVAAGPPGREPGSDALRDGCAARLLRANAGRKMPAARRKGASQPGGEEEERTDLFIRFWRRLRCDSATCLRLWMTI